MRSIDVSLFPALIKKDSKAINRAAVKTLNTMGFDAQKDIVKQAEKDMEFGGNARRAMGMTVDKAKSAKLEVTVFTKRGWLAFHLDEGKRSSNRGFRFNGRSFILVPIEEAAFTKRGSLRAKFKNKLHIIPYGRNALVFFRPKRGNRDAILIGTLQPEVRYHEDTEPDKVVNNVFQKKAHRLFKFYLNQQRS